MLSKRSICALVILAGLPVASCSCDEVVTDAPPRFTAKPSSVAFGLVCLESDNQLEITVQNIGASVGNVSWAVLPAPGGGELDPAMFTTSPEARQAMSLSPGGKQVITIAYHPSDERANNTSQLGKVHKAILQLTTDDPENETIEILLDGTVSDREPTPIFSVECGESVSACDGSGDACCTDRAVNAATPGASGRSVITVANLGPVPAGSSRDMKIKVSNLGCGQLSLPNTWTFEDASGCEATTFTIPELEAGVSIPGSPTVENIKSQEITLRFTAPPDQCTLVGDAVLATNDPLIVPDTPGADWADVFVTAESAPPAISVIPVGGLSFGEVDDGTCVEKTLTIYNSSALPIKLTRPEIVSGVAGKQSDYRVKEPSGIQYRPSPACAGLEDWNFDMELQPTTLDDCGDDEIFVTIEYCPGSKNDVTTDNDDLVVGFAGGQVRVPLKGGSNPILEVVGGADGVWFYGPSHFGCEACGAALCPSSVCDGDEDCAGESCLIPDGQTVGACESEPSCLNRCGFSDRKVLLCNVGKGDLVVKKIESDADIVHVISGDCLNKVIKPMTTQDDCCPITVTADSAASGLLDQGDANLIIECNDPTFSGRVPAPFRFEGPDEYHGPIADLVLKDGSCAEPTSIMVNTTAYLDATGSQNDVNYEWFVDAVPAGSQVPLGRIDPASPDARFFAFGRACDGGPAPTSYSILSFTPDVGGRPLAAQYKLTVKVDNGSCTASTPGGTASMTLIVKVDSPPGG